MALANGRNDVSSTTASFDPSGSHSAPAKVRSDFNGFQVGADLGVANVEGSGWNTHLGVTGGQVRVLARKLIAASTRS